MTQFSHSGPQRDVVVQAADSHVTVDNSRTTIINQTVNLTSSDLDHVLEAVRDQLRPVVTRLVERIASLEADRDQLRRELEAVRDTFDSLAPELASAPVAALPSSRGLGAAQLRGPALGASSSERRTGATAATALPSPSRGTAAVTAADPASPGPVRQAVNALPGPCGPGPVTAAQPHHWVRYRP